ncbi:YfiT family bacillithiol transferase [Halalkalibacter urbisdiaboli]|uniref:YfiT family bacillithiol transferase n=1 Tax=Halalkalibacter urbisdiaboli TaxID=1960589 RepID=UPI000B430AE0|nr:putative metal-dependent hydrolase [Halalkalibacter urbisdiaboli]
MESSLRFPIGQFEPTENPNSEQRKKWNHEISDIPKILRHIVQNLSKEQLTTPYRPDRWTVQQIVHHLADNNMNAYIRFKKALTEENPTSSSYREDLWAELIDYQETPIETSLVLLESLHARFVTLLSALQPSDFQRTFISPSHGMMNLDVAIQRFAWHGRHHIAQIIEIKRRMGWTE